MAITLETAYNLPNGSRLVFGRFDFDDDKSELSVPLELRSPPATNAMICRTVMVIRNGVCTHIARQTNPTAGLNIEDPMRHFAITTRDVPTGYTDAKAAERAAQNTPNSRRQALEAHLLLAGHIHSSLVGT